MVFDQYRVRLAWLNKPFSKVKLQQSVARTLKLSREARQRLSWLTYHRTTADGNARLTCRRFGISPKTFYRWYNRYDGQNLVTLEEKPSVSRKRRVRTYTSLQYLRIIELRREHIRWGKEKLRMIYLIKYPESPISSWHVQKIIERSGLYYHPKKNDRTQAKRRKASARKRISELKTKPRPGFLLCVDTGTRYWSGQKRYIFTAVDRYSRLAFARMYQTKSSLSGKDFLERLSYLTGGSVENIGSDNGTEFKGQFTASCDKAGIGHYLSRVRTPTDNPFNERFNRTLQDEFIALGNMTANTEVFNKKLTEWLIEYNLVRPHQSLDYLSPIQFLEAYPSNGNVFPLTSSNTLS
jgi:transposase InsO family protein